jgi:hypothetical protein
MDPPSADVTGSCDYAWNLDLGFSNPDLGVTMDMNTTGTLTKDKDEVTANLFFPRFSLVNGNSSVSGAIQVCSCGPAIVADLPQGRRLVNSSFVVKDFDTGLPQRCALVEFNGNGDPTSTVDNAEACVCRDGSTCSGNGPSN